MKEATGRSLKQYILYYRIQSAKDLLINSDASIDEVAWRSGFGTSAYFIKCFRESLGITPLNYRKTGKWKFI
jgi:AraC family transcriptional regulator